eukprot:s239_g23.t1
MYAGEGIVSPLGSCCRPMPETIEVGEQEQRALIARSHNITVLQVVEGEDNSVCASAVGRRPCVMTTGALLASLLMATALVLLSRHTFTKDRFSTLVVPSKQLQDFNQDMTCTPNEPAREPDDGLTSLEQCLERCPSVGFMAAMEFGDCRASCERRRSARKHPTAGKKAPASEPPLEGCKRTCRQHKGNFWHFLYSNCAKTCAAKTALTQVQYMQKYNVSFGKEGEEDLQAEVTALLRTRFKFKKRSSNHPFSFILETCPIPI